VATDNLGEQALVLAEDVSVAFALDLGQEPGRPLHVREEEREDAGGQVGQRSRKSHLAGTIAP
jgi:hypothetical protein